MTRNTTISLILIFFLFVCFGGMMFASKQLKIATQLETNLTNRIKGLQTQVATLTNQVNQKDTAIKLQSAEINQLKVDLGAANQAKERSENDYKSLQTDYEAVKSTNTRLVTENYQLKQRVQQLLQERD